MTLYVRIGIAAKKLGVCTKTIRRWEKAGKIHCHRTVGGHRRIAVVEIQRLYGEQDDHHSDANHQTAIYARVSSHEQKTKGDLARQVQVAQEWCKQQEASIPPVVFTDVGSGLNTTRRGLQQLCKAIEAGQIGRVIVTYPDRLTRFGFHYLAMYFQSHGVTIRCIQQAPEQSLQAELVDDLIAIVTSFSGRVHGMRSHRNHVKQAPAKSERERPEVGALVPTA